MCEFGVGELVALLCCVLLGLCWHLDQSGRRTEGDRKRESEQERDIGNIRSLLPPWDPSSLKQRGRLPSSELWLYWASTADTVTAITGLHGDWYTIGRWLFYFFNGKKKRHSKINMRSIYSVPSVRRSLSYLPNHHQKLFLGMLSDYSPMPTSSFGLH